MRFPALILLVAFLFPVSSCGDDSQAFSVSPSTVSFVSNAGADIFLSITPPQATEFDWRITGVPDWLEVVPSEGTERDREVRLTVKHEVLQTLGLPLGTTDVTLTLEARARSETYPVRVRVAVEPLGTPVASLGATDLPDRTVRVWAFGFDYYSTSGAPVSTDVELIRRIQWNPGDRFLTVTSDSDTIDHSYSEAGQREISLEVEDEEGMLDTATVSLYVN